MTTKDELATVGARVRAAREAAGLSQKKLADLIGRTQQAVHDLERKGRGGSSHLVAIADALGVSAEYLYSGKTAGLSNEASNQTGLVITELRRRAPVIGTIGAGIWREAPMNMLNSQSDQDVPYLPSGRNADLPQFGLRVEGNSMNKVVADGEFVTVCFVEHGARYTVGDIVLVERCRAGLYEATLKRLKRMTADQVVLEPESTDPTFTPIVMSSSDTEEGRIVAVAIGKYAPF